MSALLIFVTFSLSALLTFQFSRPGSLLYALDKPNARSLHDRPTPVSGGLAIMSAFFIGAGAICCTRQVQVPALLVWVALGAFLLAVTAFVDDRRHLPPLPRLVVQFAAAALLVFPAGLWLRQFELPFMSWQWPSFLGWAFSLLFVVWMTNLYNFMDGMDGFAGGMSLFGFGTYAVLGLLGGEYLFVLLNSLICAATAGFLLFNFPPARIFMGDTGSVTLGFLAAAFALWGDALDLFPLWTALLLFSPFIVDATLTLLRRLWRGEKIWQAHRGHAYQRLVQLGWGHRRTVLREYLLMTACSFSAVLASLSTMLVQTLIIGIWAALYSGLLIWLRHYEASHAEHTLNSTP